MNSLWAKCPENSTLLSSLNSSTEFSYKKEELTTVKRPQSPPKGIVLVLHGLNLKPSKMDSIGQFLLQRNFLVIRGSLKGHRGSLKEQKQIHESEWLKDIERLKCLVENYANEWKVPKYFLGYSLGALATLSHTSKAQNQIFDKQFLIAPATHTHWYSKIPGNLRIVPGQWSLPSKNLEEYRSLESTSFSAYFSMSKLRDLFKKEKSIHNIPTIIFMDPKDELVSLNRILKFKRKNNLQNWQIIQTTNANHLLKESFHHLIIDERSLGKAHWKGLLELLEKHFAEEISY